MFDPMFFFPCFIHKSPFQETTVSHYFPSDDLELLVNHLADKIYFESNLENFQKVDHALIS